MGNSMTDKQQIEAHRHFAQRNRQPDLQEADSRDLKVGDIVVWDMGCVGLDITPRGTIGRVLDFGQEFTGLSFVVDFGDYGKKEVDPKWVKRGGSTEKPRKEYILEIAHSRLGGWKWKNITGLDVKDAKNMKLGKKQIKLEILSIYQNIIKIKKKNAKENYVINCEHNGEDIPFDNEFATVPIGVTNRFATGELAPDDKYSIRIKQKTCGRKNFHYYAMKHAFKLNIVVDGNEKKQRQAPAKKRKQGLSWRNFVPSAKPAKYERTASEVAIDKARSPSP